MAKAKFLDTYDIVEFSIDLDGKRKICWISNEALAEHFGADRKSAVSVLLRNMDRIAPVAVRVARSTPDGEHVLVKTSHFSSSK